MKKLAFLIILIFIPFKTFAVTPFEEWNKLIIKNKGFKLENQSICAIDKNGNELFSYNKDKEVVPASVSKIYLTDYLLDKLGKDFTFKTDFILNENTLYINGEKDPFFVSEHFLVVLNKIKETYPNKKINKIVFYDFYFNWSKNDDITIQNLKNFLKNNEFFLNDLTIISQKNKFESNKDTFKFTSKPFYMLLKTLNVYSTNSASDLMFENFGGKEEFHNYMKEKYKIMADNLSFDTGSGLYGNKTTCILTVNVLKHLSEQIYEKGLLLRDILVVPKIDGGSMKYRMNNIKDTKKLLVKSGYIYNHDTLTGALYTQKGNIYFGIFTEYENISDTYKARSTIDKFVEKLISKYNAISFKYPLKNYSATEYTSVVKIN
jgi:D-alanyl-D-alanine carboxypeptidase